MIIKNKNLEVTISTFGAEMKSLKKNTLEYLWQGDPTFWKRSSPVLFPIVGRLLGDEYNFKNKQYKMTQHGFARDHNFELIRKEAESCTFRLVSNDSTRKLYPFNFVLDITYKLYGSSVNVKWEVQNTSNEDMYFQIGAHPAFNFLNGSIIDLNTKTKRYNLCSSPYIHCVDEETFVTSTTIDDNAFVEDAIIYDNVDSITLRDKDKSVTIDCIGFPYVGIWSSLNEGENAPFICLEPWHGITDFINHNKDFINKVGMNKLASNKTFTTEYTITIK